MVLLLQTVYVIALWQPASTLASRDEIRGFLAYRRFESSPSGPAAVVFSLNTPL